MDNVNEEARLKGILIEAINSAYEKDVALLMHGGQERAFTFRVGFYLDQLKSKYNFEGLNVDCEYNRNMAGRKTTPNFRNGVMPDLIIHQRGSNENNKLCVEFKPWWNRGQERDTSKVIDLTDVNGEYKYTLGVVVLLERDGFKIQYIQSIQSEEIKIQSELILE